MRPLKTGDYSAVDGVYNTPLDDEKGDAFTWGVQHTFGKDNNTTVAVHYDYTRMKNAIATLPIWNSTSGDFEKQQLMLKKTNNLSTLQWIIN